MNIDEKREYIEKYVKIETVTKWHTVTLTVPLVTETSTGNPQVAIYLEDILYYLEHKNINQIVQNASVINTHPKGVSGTWTFRHSNKIPGHKRKRTGVGMTNKTKTTNKEV